MSDVDNINNGQPAAPAAGTPRTPKKPKVGVWTGVMPKSQVDNMPDYPPLYNYRPSELWNWGKNMAGTAGQQGIRLVYYKTVEEKKINKAFRVSVSNFEQKSGVSPDYVMGYTRLHDGWDYQSSPIPFFSECKAMNKIPVHTMEMYFKRKYSNVSTDANGNVSYEGAMLFLDEFNASIQDQKSDLYKQLVKCAKEDQSWSESNGNWPIYFRPFHEPNISYGYDWTGFMNGADESAAKKFKLAWHSLREIYRKNAPNVKFILCFESHPESDDVPELKGKWNDFESYMPDDMNDVDMIGFDVYLKDKRYTFDDVFNPVKKFLAKYPNIPASICEASTRDESYRFDFPARLFSAAGDLGMDFVIWFNEKKTEALGAQMVTFNYRNDAVIANVSSSQNLNTAQAAEGDDLMESLAAGSQKPQKPAAGTQPGTESEFANVEDQTSPEYGKTPNMALIKFREAVKAYSSSKTFEPTINKDGVVQDRPEDDFAFRSIFGTKDLKMSYNDTYTDWLLQKNIGTSKPKLKAAESDSWYLSGPFKVLLRNQEDKREALAKMHFEKWMAYPIKVNADGKTKTDFDIALEMVQKNTTDEHKHDVQYLTSLALQEKLLMRYYEMFKDNTSDEAVPFKANHFAKDVCLNVLETIRGAAYKKALIKYVAAEIKSRQDIRDKLVELKAKAANDEDYKAQKEVYLAQVAREKAQRETDLIGSLDLMSINLTNLDNFKYTESGLLGEEILALINLGYVYLSMNDVVKASSAKDGHQPTEQENEDQQMHIDIARVFFMYAMKRIDDKDSRTGVKERYLNIDAEIGLARVKGEITDKASLDEAVKALSKIATTKEKLDPGLKVKAKFYLAWVFSRYKDINDLDADTKKAYLKIAYETYKSLGNTEYMWQAQENMKSIQRTLNNWGKKNVLQ